MPCLILRFVLVLPLVKDLAPSPPAREEGARAVVIVVAVVKKNVLAFKNSKQLP